MGVVSEAAHRGQGYAAEALQLLLDHAFRVMNLAAVHNDFEVSRIAALKAHLQAGFTELARAKGLAEALITREAYFSRSPSPA